MMTRSIVGRFLILAVLLVSLGVIAQAALIITRGSGKAVAKASPAPLAPSTAMASAAPQAAAPADAPVPSAPAAQPADAAPVRVVYPGPLGDTPVQARKFAAAVPVAPTAPPPAAPAPTPQAPQAAAAPIPAPAPAPVAAAAPAPTVPAAAPAPAKPSPVVVASADADTQPATDPAAGSLAAPSASKGGVNLNSASVEALNHLGGGHIGQSIVKHRPYVSVEDLVKKRVIRRSVYEQIKDQVAAQ